MDSVLTPAYGGDSIWTGLIIVLGLVRTGHPEGLIQSISTVMGSV